MLKDYLLDVMQQHEHGLYMCELPTGNGKTYDSARAMKEYTDSIGNDTKIIYLTTLNKNLPEDALRAAYGSEELYKRNVLRLRSNFDEVVDKILEIEVPEEMKTDAYLKLCKDVSLYRNAVEKRYADKEYIKELADRITEGDRQLRYEITKRLKNRFQTKTQRKNAIRTDAKYKWIGKLYPAVFTDDYKIILMSVSKFMKRNSILIDSSYEFLNSDLIENAVIVIDEFDATKDTIQSELIDKSLAMQEDYIQLFRQIYRTLNPNDFSSSMRQAMDEVEKSGNRNTFTTLMDEARKIAENYHVRLSIKTKEDLVDQRQIFLFNDGSFHTVLKEGAQYIRSSLNKEDNPTLSYKTVEEQYVSPAVKRQIWQTLQVIKEIKKVMGKEPERIFVEMARESQESKRTESRKKQLIDLYKVCKEEEKEIYEKLEKHEEQHLRKDKLFLYYTQRGHCMYSGERIEFDDLWDNTKYDIDHIYPQSKTMDDSLNNRVLVKKEYNSKKSDDYPISSDIQKKQGGFWKSLLDGNFITKEKYERLVRKTELTSDELAGFIERQIVETRQSTKVVADLLKKAMPDSEIVYVKARSVSKFRQDYDFVKVRDMNDLHHAKDAYLNIVVGNAYYTKFTKNAVWFIKENPGRSYNLEKMFIHDISRNGKVAWQAGNKGTIKTVRNVMNKNNILVTRRSYEVKGGLFDQQIMKKGKGQVPVKTSDERLHDINKYGGYNKAAGAYFMLVKSTDAKGNEQRTIEFVPIYKKDYIERSKENALEYLREIMKERKLSKPVILINKIKIDTLFKVDGFYMWLSGRTGNRLVFKGANELILSDEETKILKKVIKFTKRKMENKNVELSAFDGINEEELVHLYDVFVSKLQNTIYKIRLGLQASTLIDNKGKFENLNLEDKCTVLSEILHLFQCQSAAANLKLIGGPASAGILVMNNNFTKCKQISIINQSVTGIYKKEIDLLKL